MDSNRRSMSDLFEFFDSEIFRSWSVFDDEPIKDENKVQIRELLHELEEMTCELEQIQMKDLVEILKSDMDSLVQRISTSGWGFKMTQSLMRHILRRNLCHNDANLILCRLGNEYETRIRNC